MKTQIKKWGNGQGIRLSKEVLAMADFAMDEVLDVYVTDGMITLMKTKKHKTLEERAVEFGGDLNLDGEFDWGSDVGNEVW